MKPNETTIKLSRELWELGVKKKIEYGTWFSMYRWTDKNASTLYVGDGYESSIIPIPHPEIGSKIGFPIWTSCDECIEWLKGKGWRFFLYSYEHDDRRFEFYSDEKDTAIIDVSANIPIIEALLKAMVEVAKNQEKKEDE